MDRRIRIAVVIINYKTLQLVINSLALLFSELDHDHDKVIIVDNASNDGSIEKIITHIELENWTGWIAVIPSSVNGGFSAGNNIGIGHIQAKYYLLLNSDAWVLPGIINTMLNAIEKNLKVGLVGPRLEWENGKQQVSCFYKATPLTIFLNATNTGIVTKLFSLLAFMKLQFQQISELNLLNG